MIKVLICLADKTLTDVVKTAYKQFPSMTAYPAPRRKLLEVMSESTYHAVVVDLDEREDGGIIREIREASSTIEILTLSGKEQKDKFNRLKVDLNIFSCISLPLDPFELARRIVRLEKHLIERNPLSI